MTKSRCNLRGQITGAAMLGITSVAAVAAPAAAGDGKIGHEVFKGKEVTQVEQLAADGSASGRLVLVVYGGGDGLAGFAYQVSKHYEDTAPYEISLVEADDNDEDTKNAEIHFYYNGQRRVIFYVEPDTDGNALGNKMIADMNEITRMK